jgi:hypothetical protein
MMSISDRCRWWRWEAGGYTNRAMVRIANELTFLSCENAEFVLDVLHDCSPFLFDLDLCDLGSKIYQVGCMDASIFAFSCAFT